MTGTREQLKIFGRWMRPSIRNPWVMAVTCVGFGGAVLMVAWHARTALLVVEGHNLAWIVLVAFGATWSARNLRGATGLLVGATAGLATMYGIQGTGVVPLTPMGIGIALGAAAALAAAVCYVWPKQLSFGGMAIGVGLGVAAAQAIGMGPRTSGAQVLTAGAVVAMALIFGALGSQVLHAAVEVAAEPATIASLPSRGKARSGAGWESSGARRLVELVIPHQKTRTVEEVRRAAR